MCLRSLQRVSFPRSSFRPALCSLVLLLTVCLLINPASAGSIKDKCKTCQEIAKNFDKGLKKTAKSNFGGGNTRWEEKSLGNFAFSETRLVEILENLCEHEGKECHQMVEENEEMIEQWWFKVYAKGKDTDLSLWLCQRRLKLCCPSGTYGDECKECTGGKEHPCRGSGKCLGDGAREGNGACECDAGYRGLECEDCKDGYYEEDRNDTHTSCKKCDNACKSSCYNEGPEGCDDCKDGWELKEDAGCHDIDECAADPPPCNDDQYCLNKPGSKSCISCNPACSGCKGPGPAKCEECADKYYADGEYCRACHASCAGDCSDGTPKGCEKCASGYQASEQDGCTDIDECAGDPSLCAADEVCVNRPGDYHCEKCDSACDGCTAPGPGGCKACAQGYNMQESVCTDIDECESEGAKLCAMEGEECVNTQGSYSCQCQRGYTRRGNKCQKSEAKKTNSKKSSSKSTSASSKSSSKKKKKIKKQDFTADNIQYTLALGGFGLMGVFLRKSVIAQTVIAATFWLYIYWFSCRFDKLKRSDFS